MDTCQYCGHFGLDEGKGDCGHIHCRGCLKPDHPFNRFELSIPKKTWVAWCKGKRDSVGVTALKYRVEPPAFEPPFDIFYTGCRMITVVVGDKHKETYTVHAPLLLASSGYFQRALKPTFIEGQTDRVELKHVDPVYIFGNILEYLYFGKIREMQDSDGGQLTFMDPNIQEIFNVWLLAHYLQIPSLVNYAPWVLLNRYDLGHWNLDYREFVKPQNLENMYEKSPMDSVMRKFLIDLLVWGSENEFTLSDDPPKLMMRDALEEMKRKSGGRCKNPLLDVENYFSDDVQVREWDERMKAEFRKGGSG